MLKDVTMTYIYISLKENKNKNKIKKQPPLAFKVLCPVCTVQYM